MITRMRKFIGLNAEEKQVLLTAWFCLGWMRAAILTRPFKQLVGGVEHCRPPATPPFATASEMERASRFGWLVAVAARYTPWQSLCLVQVLVLQRFLAKRGIPGQFYLGVRTSASDAFDPRSLSAHAWLQCGEIIVSGAPGSEEYTVVSAFRWGGTGV
jgi:hypothetical protein